MKVVEWSEIGSEIAKELQKQRENTLKICVQATEILLAAGVDLFWGLTDLMPSLSLTIGSAKH
jgi:hypothetical protein